MHPVRYSPRSVQYGSEPGALWGPVLDEDVPFPDLRMGAHGDSMWVPPVDFVEDKQQYTILVDAPGMNKADIHVNYKDGILYVHGKRSHEKEVGDEKVTLYLLERRCGGFMRHFHLHATVIPERIRADYKNGILKVTVPKNKKATSKHISVKVS